MYLSLKFQDTIKTILNEKGKVWLSKFPTFIGYCSDKWKLKDIKPFDNLSYSFVASAYSLYYGTPVVLKLMPDQKDLLNEQKALQYYNGNGCAKLLDSEIEKGALLIESISPGNSLNVFFPNDDSKATYITIDLIKQLHSTPLLKANDYPTIDQWLALLDDFKHPDIPKDSFKKAQALSKTLLNSQGDLYLLHGDLHHQNILLKDNQEWIAIDPKGIVGELAFEVGAYLRNPLPHLLENENAVEIIYNRIHLFAKGLKTDYERIVNWGYIQSILTTCWAIEDNQKNVGDFLKMIKLFEKIKMLYSNKNNESKNNE